MLCGHPCAGRKSGIWHGGVEVQMQQLEQQWDDYKVWGYVAVAQIKATGT